MKGAFTLAAYVAIGITGAAFGQSSTHVMTVKTVKTFGGFQVSFPTSKQNSDLRSCSRA
jgi:hypothetical protein